MTPKGFRYDLRDGIGRITFARPETANSLTFEAYEGLRDLLARLETDAAARAIVLGGEGPGFCSGGDVREVIGPLLEMPQSKRLEFCRLTCDVVRRMRRLPAPIVARIHGAAAGAGAVLAAASDLRVASEDARIAFLFPRVGLSGADMGAAFLLPRLVGLGAAADLLLTGRFVEASEALRIGLFTRVVPRERLDEAADALARELARGPRLGHARTKAMIDRELHASLDQALEWEAEAQAELMAGPDFREGFEAFRARRAPRFQA